MPAVRIYPTSPKARLQDVRIPLADVERVVNQILPDIPQIPGFGWGNCRPKDASRRLKNHLDGASKYSLLQHVAHAKRRIKENITQYIDGELPHILRKIKYKLDNLKVIQYCFQIAGTAKVLEGLLRQEVALANHYCNEATAIVSFAEQNLSPGGLRTQAEIEVAQVWSQVKTDLATQITQNNASLDCLI